MPDWIIQIEDVIDQLEAHEITDEEALQTIRFIVKEEGSGTC
jgi:hypothetical protein